MNISTNSEANSRDTVSQLGTGLVEVSAVATLIGAPIAEALTLGLRSGAGLPWASMSAFGLLHVAKAALAAAVPDWLRDSMGLQNTKVVAAVGFCLPMTRNTQARRREDLGDVQAIRNVRTSTKRNPYLMASDVRRLQKEPKTFVLKLLNVSVKDSAMHQAPESAIADLHAFCVYDMDRTMRLALETIPPAEDGQPILVHEFIPDRAGKGQWWADYLVLILSLLKVVEIVVLHLLGSKSLHWFTGVGWMCGLVLGIILVVSGASRDNTAVTEDVVSGRLPSALHLGGEGKILLRIPQNVRRSVIWRVTWCIHSIASMVAILGTFLVLGENPPKVIYTWMAFQLLWLGSRTIIYYFVESAIGAKQGLVIGRPWDELSVENETRAFDLWRSLAEQQATTHPRGAKSYRYDLNDVQVIRDRLESVSWTITGKLELLESSTSQMTIFDVIGDNFLRTVAWTQGKPFSNSDIYDSALIFIEWNKARFAVPCVRVFACNCTKAVRMRFRGDSHGSICKSKVWVLWIPACYAQSSHSEDNWIYIRATKLLGELNTEIISDSDLTKRLSAQEWKVCFTKTEELRSVVGVSQEATLAMCSVLQLVRTLRTKEN